MWVAIVDWRRERFLDRPGGGPAQEILRRTCLVVGTGRARPPEGLLSDDRASRFVINVKVTRTVPKVGGSFGDRVAILGDNRSSERVR